MQETGETRDAIIEDDEKLIKKIVDANKHIKELYWIVIFAKPSKVTIDGKPALVKHICPYLIKPKPQIGMVVGEVDNKKGTIEWDVNMPQIPFDYDALAKKTGAKQKEEHFIETTSIPDAYITR